MDSVTVIQNLRRPLLGIRLMLIGIQVRPAEPGFTNVIMAKNLSGIIKKGHQVLL